LNREKPLTTGLEQKWDYLYVDDLIRAFVLIGDKGIGGKIYPIGSGEQKQMCEYVEIIRNLIDPSLLLGIGEIPYKNPSKIDNQILDITELKLDTGFKAEYDFSRGIIETIKYFKTLL
jgi:nucleoside-diphosphate-sugar epimerase